MEVTVFCVLRRGVRWTETDFYSPPWEPRIMQQEPFWVGDNVLGVYPCTLKMDAARPPKRWFPSTSLYGPTTHITTTPKNCRCSNTIFSVKRLFLFRVKQFPFTKDNFTNFLIMTAFIWARFTAFKWHGMYTSTI